MQHPSALCDLIPQNFPLKTFLTFSQTLPTPRTFQPQPTKIFSKKFLIFFPIKSCSEKLSYIFSRNPPLNFQETELSYISRKVDLEPQHIQNPGIFKTRGIFRKLSKIYDRKFFKIQLSCALFSLRPQNFFLKNIFKKPALKKILIFSQSKSFLIFCQKSLHFLSSTPKIFPKKPAFKKFFTFSQKSP